MSVWVYLPLVLSGVFGAVAPTVAGALPPSVATWLLSLGALLAGTATSISLALLTFALVAQAPVVAEQGRWSDAALRQHDLVATPLAVIAAVAVIVLGLRTMRVGRRRMRAVRDAFRLSAALSDTGEELSVLHTDTVQAFAVPGRPGRIVLSTGLLRTLDAGQRRALLAHERSHLHRHHHVHQSATQLAAAVNPLLYRLPAAVELSCERWADEDAAHVCRRDTVAAALTRAAAGQRHTAPVVVLAAAESDVAVRLAALQGPTPRPVAWRVTLLVALSIATAVAVAIALHDTERIFELAQRAYRPGQR